MQWQVEVNFRERIKNFEAIVVIEPGTSRLISKHFTTNPFPLSDDARIIVLGLITNSMLVNDCNFITTNSSSIQ